MGVDFDCVAAYYDAMYVDDEACKKEAEYIYAIAQEYGISGKLLDIACGTGAQARYLSNYFDVSGIDLSEEMLRIARAKAPHVKFWCGDMCTFRTETVFDMVVNLYGSIGFAKDIGEVHAACKCAADCLKMGGIFILTPWGSKETLREGIVSSCGEKDGIHFCRMEAIHRLSEDSAQVEMHHLIGKGTEIREFRATQKIILLAEKDYIEALKSAGFEILKRLDEKEFRMGAFVCSKK